MCQMVWLGMITYLMYFLSSSVAPNSLSALSKSADVVWPDTMMYAMTFGLLCRTKLMVCCANMRRTGFTLGMPLL